MRAGRGEVSRSRRCQAAALVLHAGAAPVCSPSCPCSLRRTQGAPRAARLGALALRPARSALAPASLADFMCSTPLSSTHRPYASPGGHKRRSPDGPPTPLPPAKLARIEGSSPHSHPRGRGPNPGMREAGEGSLPTPSYNRTSREQFSG